MMKTRNKIEEFLKLIDEEIEAKQLDISASDVGLGSGSMTSKSVTISSQSAQKVPTQSDVSEEKSAPLNQSGDASTKSMKSGDTFSKSVHLPSKSVLGTHSTIVPSKDLKKYLKNQLSTLVGIKTSMEKFKEVLGKYFFSSIDLEKDKEKIGEIFETLHKGIRNHRQCNFLLQHQTEVAKKEHVDLLNRDAIDFLNRMRNVRIETCQVLRNLAPVQEEYNYLETQRLCPERGVFEKEAELVEREAKIGRRGERETEKLESILQVQEKIIKHYESELNSKMAEVERQKRHLQNYLAYACETWHNIPQMLRDLKFANLNLIFEYFCLRNEFVAASNRVKFYCHRRDPNIQLKFCGLFALEAEPEESEESVVVESPQSFHDEYEGEQFENVSVYSRDSLHSRLSYGAVPWTGPHETKIDGFSLSETIAQQEGTKDQEKKEKEKVTRPEDFPSHPSVALTVTQEDVENMEEQTRSEESHTDVYLQGIILKGKKTKINWFTAHRTSMTSIVEEELRVVQEAIVERSRKLQDLVNQLRRMTRKRSKKYARYEVDKVETLNAVNIAVEIAKELDKTKLAIADSPAIQADWMAKHKEQDALKDKLRSRRHDLKPQRKDLLRTRLLEAQARKTIYQQEKDLAAVKRALNQAEVNQKFLSSWTRQVLDRRAVNLKKQRLREEKLKAQIAKLQPRVTTEWDRVNSSIVQYEAKIDEVKQKVRLASIAELLNRLRLIF